MKKALKWLYLNKKPCSGLLALLLYLADNILDLSNKLCLSSGWYYTFVTVLFVGIGFAIHGKGIQNLKVLEELIENDGEENVKEVVELIKAVTHKDKDTDDTNINNSG